jgi:hypothetical protein
MAGNGNKSLRFFQQKRHWSWLTHDEGQLIPPVLLRVGMDRFLCLYVYDYGKGSEDLIPVNRDNGSS